MVDPVTQQEAPPEEVGDEAPEGDLADQARRLLSGEGLEDDEAPEPETPAVPATPVAGANDAISTLREEFTTRYDQQDERLARAEAENNILLGMLRDARGNGDREEVPAGPTKAELLEMIRKDPVAAIELIAERKATERAAAVRDEFHSVREQDRTSNQYGSQAMADFPELETNPKFAEAVKQEITIMKRAAGGKLGADAIYNASARVFSRMSRAGELGTAPPKPGPRLVPSRRTARPLQDDAIVPQKTGSPREGFSTVEQRAIADLCKEWGITEEKYYKQYANQKKEDASYGS